MKKPAKEEIAAEYGKTLPAVIEKN